MRTSPTALLLLRSIVLVALARTPHAWAQVFPNWESQSNFEIPDAMGGVPSGICSELWIPRGHGTITSMRVTVTLSHTWAGDLTLWIEDPAKAQPLTILNRPGRTGTGLGSSVDLSGGVPLRFADDAVSSTSAETMGVGCTSLQIVGSTCGPSDYLPAPDTLDTPAGQGTDLAQFIGSPSDGGWLLCFSDSADNDTGFFYNWRLELNNDPTVVLFASSFEGYKPLLHWSQYVGAP